MRVSNPLLWKFPVPAFLRSDSSGVDQLSGGEKLLLLAVIVSVLLDILTNIFNPSPAVAPLKGLLMVLVVCSFRTFFSYLVTSSFLGIFALRELNMFYTQHDVYLVGDLTFFMRIMFFITWLLVFHEKRDRPGFLRCVLEVSVATAVLSVFCQIAGALFHIGFFQAYGGRLGRSGYKGLFLGENDTSVFYLILFIEFLHLWRQGKRLFAPILLCGLILLGMGSKTSLLGALVVPILYFFFVHTFRSPLILSRFAIRPRLALLWTASICVAGAIAFFAVYRIYDVLTAIKYDQLLRVYKESGFLSSLLSFRDKKAIGYFLSIGSLPDVLFGLQVRTKLTGFLWEDPGVFMYEIDLFDYLGRVGLLGVVLTTGLIWKCARVWEWRTRTPELKTLLVTVLLLGCTVGHTLISSQNAVWIGFFIVAFARDLTWPKGDSSRTADRVAASGPGSTNGQGQLQNGSSPYLEPGRSFG